MTFFNTAETPVGDMTMVSDGKKLKVLAFTGQHSLHNDLPGAESPSLGILKDLPIFDETRRWLDEFFEGHDPGFVPELDPEGTPFQKDVWNLVLKIPYGQVTTYGSIAMEIAANRGIPKMSAQAVGGAVKQNPIALIVPCHRVVGADGNLVGYFGNLPLKWDLLKMEGQDMSRFYMPEDMRR